MNNITNQKHRTKKYPVSSVFQQPDSAQLALLAVSGIALVAAATYSTLAYWFEEPFAPIVVDPASETRDRSAFDSVVLEARAAFVFDIARNEVLFSRNAEAQLPLASITKLMTALASAELMRRDEVIPIDGAALAQEGDSGFVTREAFRFRDLLDFTLLASSNDGAYALALAAFNDPAADTPEEFVRYMNKRADDLGLLQTHFLNPTGLDVHESLAGGYGSARDAAVLLGYIISNHPEIIESTRLQGQTVASLAGIEHEAENTNDMAGNIPGLIASKTGSTDLAGRNLAIVFDAGIARPIAVVVLGSSDQGRFQDVEKLVAASLSSL